MDRIEGRRLKIRRKGALTRKKHYVDAGLIADLEDGTVRLSANAAVVVLLEDEEDWRPERALTSAQGKQQAGVVVDKARLLKEGGPRGPIPMAPRTVCDRAPCRPFGGDALAILRA